MLSVLTWNMDYWKRSPEQRQSAWTHLTEVIKPDIALLQECVPPEDLNDRYQIIYEEMGGSRPWGSAVLVRDLPLKAVEFENSQVGAVVAAEVTLPDDSTITVISVYGAFCKDNYVTTTMHRILSDLTPLLHGQRSKRTFVMGGDYNVSTQWDENHNDPSHKLVLDRITDFGLVDCTLQHYKGLVQTNRHPKSDIPWQNDYINVSKSLAKRLVSCEVLDNEDIRNFSDHNPVIAYFK